MDNFRTGTIRTVVIGRFEDAKSAREGCLALESILEDLGTQTSQLFERQGGTADAVDIEKVYARHGLRNNNGWEQEFPVLVNGPDLAWALPSGAEPDDIENILLTLGAVDVTIHSNEHDPEEWRTAPHPMFLDPEGTDVEPADAPGERDDHLPRLGRSPKRTIH